MNRADLIDWSLHYAMRGMPTSLCSSLGARLSLSMGKKAHPQQHRNALALFAGLRPDYAADPAACDAAADRLWRNVGRTFAEFAVSHRILRSGRVAIDRPDWLHEALNCGRPLVMIFPHLGNWELSEMQIGFLCPGRGAVIVAPPARTARAMIAERVRSKAPARLLAMSPTVWRQGLQMLRQPGGILMVAGDEQAKDRVWAPSFGRPLRTDGNLGKAARLALLTGAIVLPFHNERLAGTRFVTRVLEPMTFEGSSKDDAAVLEAVRRMDDALASPIRRLLDQWYMALNYTDPISPQSA